MSNRVSETQNTATKEPAIVGEEVQTVGISSTTSPLAPYSPNASAKDGFEADGKVHNHATGSTGVKPSVDRPPAIPVVGGYGHFIDIETIDLELVIDATAGTARVEAVVEFEMPFEGYPVFDLDQDIDRLVLNGDMENADLLRRLPDPDNESEVRCLGRRLEAGTHQVTIGYDLKTEHLKFNEGRVEFFQKATDLTPGYSEMFFPSNTQFDQYALNMVVRIEGSDADHRIFTNGEQNPVEGGVQIRFPDHFNTTSFYLHIVDPSDYIILEDAYKDIPLTIYGKDIETLEAALETTKKTFAELEDDYGPYDHPSFIGLILDDYRGGMEYNGATITSPSALEHEIFHSWFARGVLASGGNSGWIDEALARWRDRGYPRAENVSWSSKSYPQLAGRSPYARVTQRASYKHGSDVMSEVDYLLAEVGGLKPILKELFQTYRRQPINTELFLEFILERTPEEHRALMRRIFERKLLGNQPIGCC